MLVAARPEIPLCGNISTGRAGLAALLAFEQACRAHRHCEIRINTRQLDWLDANLSALLCACLYRLTDTHGLRFSFDREQIRQRFSILARNGFVCAEGLSLPDWYGSAVRLQAFHADQDEDFVQYIQHKVLGHPRLQLCDDQLSDMTRSFVELFSNVNLHANTRAPLFACGQHFGRKGQLKFSLVDLGDGYLPAIQRRQPGISTAAQAIPWAVQPGHTTRPPEPGYYGTTGGFGLPDLIGYCQQVRGELQIVSGDAYWSSHAPQQCQPIQPFAGTVVNVTLPCPAG